MPRYIDADALLAEAKRLSGPETGDGWSNAGVYVLIERQPTADVRPVVRGEWKSRKGWSRCVCSICSFENGSKTHFCPNCGSDNRTKGEGA